MAWFIIIGQISNRQTIASGNSIRELDRLQNSYGNGRWRKHKGEATVQLRNGKMEKVELHWYEAHGVGRVEEKIKRRLD